ncbi:flagellin [Candidatus Magnetaquicoccus inordinatus]|uniref:flagellin N-terminal helical domain-containing protein n=1 Tax=Candidatus Magnetaquicoccus inordinatus TaxID=2496818 RepID=UPI00102BDFF2|nr:flagellin [Candidatus Magnetaquicoccus inordinatus]
MSLTMNTNVAALATQRNLSSATNRLSMVFERMSSGKRINRAADDAAGLSIATRMNAQVRGFNQALRNVNDGVSLSQVAQGALKDVQDTLQRMRELAVQAANDTNSARDRQTLHEEFNQLRNHISQVAATTDFNGTKLLDGSFSGKTFHVSSNRGQTLSPDAVMGVQPSVIGSRVEGETGGGVQSESVASLDVGAWSNVPSNSVVTVVADGICANAPSYRDSAALFTNDKYDLSSGGDAYFQWKAHGNNQFDIFNVGVSPNNYLDSNSVIAGSFSTHHSYNGSLVIQDDTWYYTRIHIDSIGNYTSTTATSNYDNSGGSVIKSYTGSVASWNSVGQSVSLFAIHNDAYAGVNASMTLGFAKVVSSSQITSPASRSLADVSLTSQSNAEESISVIDNSIKDVAGMATTFGAFQNQMDSIANDLMVMSQNTSGARSRIEDADYAAETANLAKNSIIQQAGTAILAQANQQPTSVLKLLNF